MTLDQSLALSRRLLASLNALVAAADRCAHASKHGDNMQNAVAEFTIARECGRTTAAAAEVVLTGHTS